MIQRTMHTPRPSSLPPVPERKRHDCYGRSRQRTLQEGEEAKPPRELRQSDLVAHTTRDRCPQHCQTFGAAAPTSSRSATPSADHQHHLPGPPSRRTTARDRAATPRYPAVRSPSCPTKPPADHGRHTNIRSRRPDVKSKLLNFNYTSHTLF
jgi:hypothetical protein